MKIQVVEESTATKFEKAVNEWLEGGWELHGLPNIQSVVSTSGGGQWDGGDIRSITSTTRTRYTQVLVSHRWKWNQNTNNKTNDM